MAGLKWSITIGVVAVLAACGERERAPATNEGAVTSEAVTNAAPVKPDNAVVEPADPAPREPLQPPPSTLAPPPLPAAACLTQEGEKLTVAPLRAIGTEPFWGARIEGRCVTYSTPEDQAGTRIWTKFTPGPDGGIWAGALNGRQFELRTRNNPPPGCSDGMSDNRYPLSVTLRVGGETRSGCARPL